MYKNLKTLECINIIIYFIFCILEIFHIIYTSWYDKQNLPMSIKKLKNAIKQYNVIYITLLKYRI